MKVYEVDLMNYEITTHDFEYVSDIRSFESELDNLYMYWFYSRTNAINYLKTTRSMIERDATNLF